VETDPFDLGLYWDDEEDPEADSILDMEKSDMCDCYLPYVTCPEPEICKGKP
jgi:hypothetical protein